MSEIFIHSYSCCYSTIFFFFNDTATTEIYTLSLHDALPICVVCKPVPIVWIFASASGRFLSVLACHPAGSVPPPRTGDRKSTRLNSSHSQISYAVFCLKKKKQCIYSANPLAQKWLTPQSVNN